MTDMFFNVWLVKSTEWFVAFTYYYVITTEKLINNIFCSYNNNILMTLHSYLLSPSDTHTTAKLILYLLQHKMCWLLVDFWKLLPIIKNTRNNITCV